MTDIIWFKDIGKKDIGLVGGKGMGLGHMFNAKLNVPPGFCISAQAYESFLIENSLQPKIKAILSKLNCEDTKKLDDASKKIKELIMKAKMGAELQKKILEAYKQLGGFVAVRSSATAEDLPTASFAGQQSTYLNVNGEKELLKSVQMCWASLFEPRAIFYRDRNKFDHNAVLICVVVQKMVNSDCAGVMFTVNPVTNNRDEILIEGSYGLGEMVVSGEVTPDSFILDKKTARIKQKNIGTKNRMLIRDKNGKNLKLDVDTGKQEQQIVPDAAISEIAKLGARIEQYFKYPQDIEWAIEKGQIYLLQSRPITTLK
jgi:pyruvate,water dikinase